jgi:serine phosphatase RsbU (regulator of sigma subunit)
MTNDTAGRVRADVVEQLRDELKNFEDIAQELLPQHGQLPRLHGIDLYGGTVALNGIVGGDHIIYIDYKQRFDLRARAKAALAEGRQDVAANLQRCQATAGIALIDVSGHRITDALLAAMLHQALLLGAIYELDRYGQITKQLFENLNTRFYQSSAAHKFIALIYGEISEDARFRFLSAAQPFPIVFSNEYDRCMEVSEDLCVSFPPLGIKPSFDVIDRSTTKSVLGFKDHYELNEWVLMGTGDILLLHTDGFAEHGDGIRLYVQSRLEELLREVKDQGAREIFEAITQDLRTFAEPSDDISLVVVKRM